MKKQISIDDRNGSSTLKKFSRYGYNQCVGQITNKNASKNVPQDGDVIGLTITSPAPKIEL